MKIEVLNIPKDISDFDLLQDIAAECITLADKMKREGKIKIDTHKIFVGEEIDLKITM